MNRGDERPRIRGPRVPAVGVFRKALAVAGTAVLLAGAFLVSIVLLVVLMTLGLAAWGYLWWRTRDLRKQMRDQFAVMQARTQDQGEAVTIIEGEFTRAREPDRER